MRRKCGSIQLGDTRSLLLGGSSRVGGLFSKHGGLVKTVDKPKGEVSDKGFRLKFICTVLDSLDNQDYFCDDIRNKIPTFPEQKWPKAIFNRG